MLGKRHEYTLPFKVSELTTLIVYKVSSDCKVATNLLSTSKPPLLGQYNCRATSSGPVISTWLLGDGQWLQILVWIANQYKANFNLAGC